MDLGHPGVHLGGEIREGFDPLTVLGDLFIDGFHLRGPAQELVFDLGDAFEDLLCRFFDGLPAPQPMSLISLVFSSTKTWRSDWIMSP
jgi:hypothetical protein